MVKLPSLEQIINCDIDKDTAIEIHLQIEQCLSGSASECWQCLTQNILKPDHPFKLHQLLYETTFARWDINHTPPPAWYPTDEQIRTTNIAVLMQVLQLDSYHKLHQLSIQNPTEFWETMIQRLGIRLREPYSEIVDLSKGVECPQWLVNARFNIAESCFQAPAEATAIICQPEDGEISRLSYGELNALSNRVANGLHAIGYLPGDAIAIIMPMTAESVAIYLGIIKAGYVVVSIADSFAAKEIATRLRISHAKGIFTQDTILRAGKQLPLYSKILEANAPKAIVLSSNTPTLRPEDLTWEDFLVSNSQFETIATHPSAYTNILFSSGTTGEPKAIPWTQTTPIKCAVDGHLHHDIHRGDVVAWPTNLGWMMGPWLIYASLINRATIGLYYGTPTDRKFGQFVEDAKVNLLGVVPSLVNTWKTTNCMRGLDWRAIKAFSSTGECSNARDMLFLMSLAGYKPIIEYCGGTEIGGAYITGTIVQPCAPATFTTPALGLNFVILDEDGHSTNNGEAFIIPPSIGLSTELLNKDHHQVYFADTPPFYPSLLRRHGDQIESLPNNTYRALGRVDDTMNLNGIKVSSAEIEQILNTVEGICETAAISIYPSEGGPNQLVVYAVTQEIQPHPEALKTSLQRVIREHLNPLFKIYELIIIESLPRTASNKVMRRVLREQYQQSNSLKKE